MNAHLENATRCSATGVTSGAVLIVMLTMAASTLFTPESTTRSASSTADVTYVARSPHSNSVKKI